MTLKPRETTDIIMLPVDVKERFKSAQTAGNKHYSEAGQILCVLNAMKAKLKHKS